MTSLNTTSQVKIKKLNFPRIRNIPNKIICEDETGKIDIVYFNSREGYLRKIFPINEWVIISGKVNYFRDRYQITNPDYVTNLENQDYGSAFDWADRAVMLSKEGESLAAKANVYYKGFQACRSGQISTCLLYTSPSPRDRQKSRMPSSA